ncbi:hypothetical protein AAHZ94_34785, partial [Streptomyces sp. HSW2009]
MRLAGGSFACGPRAEGFAVVARIPHAGQARPERAAPAPADGPGWPCGGAGGGAPRGGAGGGPPGRAGGGRGGGGGGLVGG